MALPVLWLMGRDESPFLLDHLSKWYTIKVKSNEKNSKEKHFICSRTREAPGKTPGTVNRMHQGRFSTDADGAAGSSFGRAAQTRTQRSITWDWWMCRRPSLQALPLRLWQISRNLLGRVDCFLFKRGLVFAGIVSRLHEYCANGGECRPSWATRWLRSSPPRCQPRVLLLLAAHDQSARQQRRRTRVRLGCR